MTEYSPMCQEQFDEKDTVQYIKSYMFIKGFPWAEISSRPW